MNRWKQCRGKKKYATMTAAERGAYWLWVNNPNEKTGLLHAYRCPDCHSHHVGHKPKEMR